MLTRGERYTMDWWKFLMGVAVAGLLMTNVPLSRPGKSIELMDCTSKAKQASSTLCSPGIGDNERVVKFVKMTTNCAMAMFLVPVIPLISPMCSLMMITGCDAMDNIYVTNALGESKTAWEIIRDNTIIAGGIIMFFVATIVGLSSCCLAVPCGSFWSWFDLKVDACRARRRMTALSAQADRDRAARMERIAGRMTLDAHRAMLKAEARELSAQLEENDQLARQAAAQRDENALCTV